MSSIFFTATRPEGEPQVVCQIYSETGRILANHFMTLEGAIVRMHDLEAAIEGCRKLRVTDTQRHFHLYADGREFGICYPDRATAERVKSEYRTTWPLVTYRMRPIHGHHCDRHSGHPVYSVG